MLNLQHPNSNTFHGAPSNWNGEPIDTLPTVSARGGHASFWQFDPEELKALERGGSVQLTVYTPQHPVFSLEVVDWPETRHDATGAPLTLVTVGDDAGVAMLTTEEVETLNALRTGSARIASDNGQRDLTIGMVIAAAIIQRTWGQNTMSLEILAAAGIKSVEDMEKLGCEQYDIAPFRNVF